MMSWCNAIKTSVARGRFLKSVSKVALVAASEQKEGLLSFSFVCTFFKVNDVVE